MNHPARGRLIALLALCAVAALPQAALGQTIIGIEVLPSPACVGKPVTANVLGTEVCTNVVVDFGDNTSSPPQDGLLPLPFLKATGYTAVGTYQLTVTSNCNVMVPGGFTALEVKDCPVAGPIGDGGIYRPRDWTAVQVTEGLIRMRPKITLGPLGGIVQPGNEQPFLILGEHFPRPAEDGEVFLVGPWGSELLNVWGDWNPDGSGVALTVPDSITDEKDQQAALVIKVGGVYSNIWPVDFIAARETRTLLQSEVALVSCSTSSNVDCCNGSYDADIIQWFCGGDPGASYSGYHMTQWGSWPDNGIDRYRIELANGWEINTILFLAEEEEGESQAWRISPGAKGKSSWEEEIAWWTTGNDEVFYRGWVSITGPRGIPHK